MPERVPQSVAKLIVFRAINSTDHVTPATGKTIAITISKNGGAFGNPAAGALNATEISSGFYKAALGIGDFDTIGPLAWRGAGTGIDDVGDVYEVATDSQVVASGTSDSGTTLTMVDAARTEADTDYWKDDWILFTSGNIAGQCRLITAFNAGTDTITFTPATTQAVATQTYQIIAAPAIGGGTPPTAAAIATAVWQDATAGDFTTASSIGKALYINNVAPGGAGGLLISGANTGPLSISGGVTFSNSGGDALTCSSSGSNGRGIVATGNGTGAGMIVTGGATGPGLSLVGGGTSGDALLTATTSGHGATFAGTGTTKHGINATGGATTSHGINATGGGVGHGILATSGGGATGDGIKAVSAATDGNGVSALGNGTGNGILATSGSGATGNGIYGLGASTNGHGMKLQGTGVFHGLSAAGGVGGGSGIVASAPGGVNGGYGIFATGAAANDGIRAVGGATGHGFYAGGGSSSGDGIHAEAATSGHGLNLVAAGTSKHGLLATGGTGGTSDGIKGAAGTGGVDIRGAITGNITGNLSGSVGSLTTNNDKTGYTLTVTPPTAATIATTVWQDLLAGADFGTAASIGKLLKDDIDAAISTRGTGTALDAAGVRGAVGLASANLDTQIGTLATPAQVKTQVVAALNTDTYGEPTGAPAATVTLVEKLGRLYQALRNKLTVTASSKAFYDDGGSSLWSKGLADDGSTYTEDEGA